MLQSRGRSFCEMTRPGFLLDCNVAPASGGEEPLTREVEDTKPPLLTETADVLSLISVQM